MNERKSAVGQTGEEIVLQCEKKNNKKYKNQIIQVSNIDAGLRYDIDSFDKIDFHITLNEI